MSMIRPADRQGFATSSVVALAAGTALLHVVTNAASPYGFQRDEFLYMAMGEHLRLWRMDFPPLIAIVARVTRATLGDSRVTVRFVPALAAALLVGLAALVARALGGGRFAQVVAAITVVASPLFLRAGTLFQPVVLDQLWWTLALFALVKLGSDAPRPGSARSDRLSTTPSWWVVLGVVCGIGLLTKFSMLFFGVGLLAGLVLAPQRVVLLTRWPWLAGLIALVIGSPSIVGQIRLGFPVVGQMAGLHQEQLVHVSVWSFVTEQLLYGPGVLLGGVGVVYLLRAASMRPYRAVAWTCIATWVLLLVLHGKPYYIGPIYPTLFGAGAVALERWTEPLRGRRGSGATAVRVVSVGLIVAYGIVILPFGLPVIPPRHMAAYSARVGITAAVTTNQGRRLPLPQDYADMLGWPQQVAALARVYDSLPPERRRQAVLIADNYGEAGAIDYYGPRYGLPRAVSAAGSYWFFGPGDKPGAVAITVGVQRQDLAPFFGRITPAGRVVNPWGVPEERDVPIFVCEQPRRTLQEVWPSLAGRN